MDRRAPSYELSDHIVLRGACQSCGGDCSVWLRRSVESTGDGFIQYPALTPEGLKMKVSCSAGCGWESVLTLEVNYKELLRMVKAAMEGQKNDERK